MKIKKGISNYKISKGSLKNSTNWANVNSNYFSLSHNFVDGGSLDYNGNIINKLNREVTLSGVLSQQIKDQSEYAEFIVDATEAGESLPRWAKNLTIPGESNAITPKQKRTSSKGSNVSNKPSNHEPTIKNTKKLPLQPITDPKLSSIANPNIDSIQPIGFDNVVSPFIETPVMSSENTNAPTGQAVSDLPPRDSAPERQTGTQHNNVKENKRISISAQNRINANEGSVEDWIKRENIDNNQRLKDKDEFLQSLNDDIEFPKNENPVKMKDLKGTSGYHGIDSSKMKSDRLNPKMDDLFDEEWVQAKKDYEGYSYNKKRSTLNEDLVSAKEQLQKSEETLNKFKKEHKIKKRSDFGKDTDETIIDEYQELLKQYNRSKIAYDEIADPLLQLDVDELIRTGFKGNKADMYKHLLKEGKLDKEKYQEVLKTFRKEQNKKAISEGEKALQSGIGMVQEDDIFSFKKVSSIALSGMSAIQTYKEKRREGKGVISSVVTAGSDFALSEMVGPLTYTGIQLLKAAPSLAVSGVQTLQTENRKMNSAARLSTFGDAQFHDTQQLATMRQSGMELAKMANYRLEQTLMGSEARYMHR